MNEFISKGRKRTTLLPFGVLCSHDAVQPNITRQSEALRVFLHHQVNIVAIHVS